jgi:hypothetical protein
MLGCGPTHYRQVHNNRDGLSDDRDLPSEDETKRWIQHPPQVDEPLLALSVTYSLPRARAADQVAVKGSAIYDSDCGGC